jgi:high-affinity Fe2+/Pb2+ permease
MPNPVSGAVAFSGSVFVIRFRIKKRARLWASMTASASFIGLAIYGWGLPISTAAAFLVICVLFLAGIVGLAVLSGWLLRKLRQRQDHI